MSFVDIIIMAVKQWKRAVYNVIGCCYNVSYKIKTRHNKLTTIFGKFLLTAEMLN